jgi:hypothetical protein
MSAIYTVSSVQNRKLSVAVVAKMAETTKKPSPETTRL